MSKKVADKIFVNGQFYSTDLDCNMTCSEAVAVCDMKKWRKSIYNYLKNKNKINPSSEKNGGWVYEICRYGIS